MNTTAQITPAPASEGRTFGEMLAELAPLIGFIPTAGPPAVLVLGPWLFLVLMLAGPFACLVALVVAMIVAATVVAALAAVVIAPPYLLVRHLRRHRERQAFISAPAARVVAIKSPRVAA